MKAIKFFKQSVLPFLLILMLATADLGRAFYQYNTLTKAVRDGVRYLSNNALLGSTGVMIPIDNPLWFELSSKTKNLMVYGNISGSGNPIIPDFTNAIFVIFSQEGEHHVRVTATYKYVPILFPDSLPTFGIGDPISLDFTLKASTTMRAL